ncbi:hypothetical protein [Allochromatium tepidum]|uniref:Flagellar basal-body/hook protein C-terminal domain-containing protein n=1 Tax=Allochromatium tepidum TaxID=553982 RepID=A0ABM7QJQ0_9GAMM|nr:hypothetical protein [Allochromatium tepidum]BCU05985.1 hypothetical protein Atep_06620 [Allochromatium tepidum]
MITGIVGQAGWMGMQRGMDGLSQNASEIASAGVKPPAGTSVRDISEPLVDQTENLRQVEASAKVLQSSTDAFDHLIDILA